VRHEAGGERSFIELVRDGKLAWRALIPPYAGRPGAPGVAWNADVLTVRVMRDQRAELFAVSIRDAAKIGDIKLAPDHGPARKTEHGPVTLTDRVRSYELVEGAAWHQLVVLDLATGHALWKQELGDQKIDDAGVEGSTVWVRQGAITRRFGTRDGVERGPNSS